MSSLMILLLIGFAATAVLLACLKALSRAQRHAKVEGMFAKVEKSKGGFLSGGRGVWWMTGSASLICPEGGQPIASAAALQLSSKWRLSWVPRISPAALNPAPLNRNDQDSGTG